MEKTRKWRWGVNRWWIFLFSILTLLAIQFVAVPIQPHIQVAPEEFHFNLFGLEISTVNTITSMLLGDLVIILIALTVRNSLKGGSLIPKGITSAMETVVEMLYNLAETTAGKWTKTIFPWFATIIIIVFVANIIKMIPGFETVGFLHETEHGYAVEKLFGNVYNIVPTEVHEGETAYNVVPWFRGLSTDLNFTVALALISVIMTQVIGFRAQKLWYLTKFINFTTIFKKPALGFMDFIVGILELISELAKILSFAFRLFGVMFSGTVLVALVGSMVPVFVPSLIFAFELFMGVIQAFVFGMLTLVFMAQATQGHGEHADH